MTDDKPMTREEAEEALAMYSPDDFAHAWTEHLKRPSSDREWRAALERAKAAGR